MIKEKKIGIKAIFENAKEQLSISEDRYETLLIIADSIVDQFNDRNKVNINFICTHNSRRSQMGQAWAFYAIEYFNLINIFPFSGGTEVTAFHRNTVRALKKSGFEFNIIDFSHQNPRYIINFKGTDKTIMGFSKLFDHEINQYPYLAITTCDNANEHCPFIPDAIERFHLGYTDPKSSDNTKEHHETYIQVSNQIAGECYIIFEEVHRQLHSE